MKLYYSTGSPFARKVRVVMHEKGITPELIAVVTLDNPPELHAANPSGKIPAVVLDNGETIAESANICRYLAPELHPNDLGVHQRDGLGIGIMEAAVRYFLETKREPQYQSPIWLERYKNAILRSLPVLEADLPKFGKDFLIDHISVAVALGYTNLRLPELEWEKKHPKLSAWYQQISERPSLKATVPI